MSTFFEKLKNPIVTVVAVLVVALGVYLTKFGGIDQIKDYFTDKAAITVSSLTGDDYFTNQKMRFAITNAEVSQKVVWVLDDQKVFLDNKVIEQIFEYDSTKANLARTPHRIDVFYRSGDRYKGLTRVIDVINFDPGQISLLDKNQLRFKFQKDWSIEQATLQIFKDGKFHDRNNLQVDVSDNNTVLGGAANIGLEDSWIEYTVQDPSTKKEWVLLQNAKGVLQ